MNSGTESRTHELKTLPKWFNAAVIYGKNFELRKDDRDYRIGDRVMLKEWDEERGYTGRELSSRTIRYILRDCPEYGLEEGYCIIGF